jgi:flavin reductase like protein
MDEARKPSEAMVTAFRGCVGEFATGVAVVTAEHEGVPAGMTLNSFTSVSLEPLLVLVSLASGSRTLHAARSSGRFAVSFLARGQQDVALEFSQPWAQFPLGHVARDREGFLPEVISITHGGGEPLVFHKGRFGGFEVDATVPAGHLIGIDEGSGW